ncbi:MAG: PA3496 family putative envelope integrity protein [Parahaliea sp.]
MGDTNQGTVSNDAIDDFFEPLLGDISSVDEDFIPASSEKQRLAEKRRRAEQRLEQRRLREELGFYDLELEDF